jgi:hypothetical protein
VLVHVVNFYLDDARKEQRERIISSSFGDEQVQYEELAGYVREAIRQDPVTVGVIREAATFTSAGGETIENKEKVFLSLKKTMMDVRSLEYFSLT